MSHHDVSAANAFRDPDQRSEARNRPAVRPLAPGAWLLSPRAEQQLERRETDVDLARVSAELQKALVRLKVAERRRRRTGTRPGPPGV
ncbi:MAG: hypothetical protein E6J43_03770 [Chloroflexi bacterium]|nr:MAG: hypothetical protein E6J43_03770 [Chloroflexota bacterium]